MPDQEAEPGFTVVDRRRRGDDEPAAASRPNPREEAPVSRPAPARSAAPPPSASIPPPRGEPLLGPPPGALRADFTSFCVMMYSDALVHLGQVPDPMTGERHPDLEQAQFTIDLLAMLREKTEGNRTPEETGVLEEILATLRMAFVRANQRG